MDHVDPGGDVFDLIGLQVADEVPPDIRPGEIPALRQELLDVILPYVRHPGLDSLPHCG